MTTNINRSDRRWGRWLSALLLALASIVVPATMTAASADIEPGDTAYVGRATSGQGGSSLFPVWLNETSGVGEPDFWAYCIELAVDARTNAIGHLGGLDSFLGNNEFATSDVVQGKVFWILAHSYPALSLQEFGESVGVSDITEAEAIAATQYAIWYFTDGHTGTAGLSTKAKAALASLRAAAQASDGMTPEEIEVTATITAPSEPQVAGSLVGPFTVATNQAQVSVSADPAVAITDASGTPIDTEAVTDGQALYLDLRSSRTAGSATVTVAAQGTGSTGTIVSIAEKGDGKPTKGNHAQSLILVTPSTTKTTNDATVTWDAVPDPVIGTSLLDSADGDRVLPWNGGTVVDTVAYQNLTVGQTYTVAGELMLKSDGAGTGITGSATFTATEANGEVAVTFVVPEGYAGQSLVAFEWLFEGEIAGTAEDSVAEHTDLDDAEQTVVIEEKPEDPPVPPVPPADPPVPPQTPETPDTPDTPETPTKPTEHLAKTGSSLLGLGGVALLAILAGAGLMLTRRRA